MSSRNGFHVLVATDGSTPARAALTTAVRFPWPVAARGSAVVAKQVGADVRSSILSAALDRTTESTAGSAVRALSTRWPDAHARAVDVLAALTPPHHGHVTLLNVVETMHVPTHGLAPAGTRATVAAEVSRINKARSAAAL